MKGSTFRATMERLGVTPSFSRPRVSDDNPYSESLFRTLKYRPSYPAGAFESLEAAQLWVQRFVHWYNEEHLHSALSYVTPDSRHRGLHEGVLSRRRAVYQRAQRRLPDRWNGRSTRAWKTPTTVWLNPPKGVAQGT